MSLPTAPFGATGHVSSRVIFGAAGFFTVSAERAWSTMEQLTAAGVNHIDTAASYGDSELALAPWLAENRSSVFLATKTGERSGAEARAELEKSLERLGVDSVDLIQLHNLVDADEWATAHGPGGALEAMVAARDAGIVRFIGVTGHGLRVARAHIESLERFPFDSVLFPYNPAMLADPAYADDVTELLELCTSRDVAVQTIKSIARRRWPSEPAKMFSWYEPMTDDAAIGKAVRYVLSNDQLFLNSSSDLRLLPATLAAASGDLTPPAPDELTALAANQALEPLFDAANPV